MLTELRGDQTQAMDTDSLGCMDQGKLKNHFALAATGTTARRVARGRNGGWTPLNITIKNQSNLIIGNPLFPRRTRTQE